jgi:4-carboxymuconolactone decarboxylase
VSDTYRQQQYGMLKTVQSKILLLTVLCAIFLDHCTTIHVLSFQGIPFDMSSQQSSKKRSISDSQNEKVAAVTSTSLNAVPDHIYTSRTFKPRYTGPQEETMTQEQRQIRQVILETRPRTGLSGPFGPWLAVPDIANPAQLLGRACRYGTTLSFRESELVILLTGAKTKSHAEFDIHVGEAIKAGISMNIINAIPRDDQFSYSAVMERVVPLLKSDDDSTINAREWAIVQFTAELLDTYTVSDYTYAITKQALGNQDSVLVEITSIVGYYTYVSYTLNVFQIPSS